MKWLWAVGFVATVLAANYATTRWGLVPVGFGLVTTAGTYFAGAAFVLRDSLQDASTAAFVLAVIAAGAGLSWFVASPSIALASGLAFALSEAADLGVYTPLREHGYLGAALASNVVGALVDTYVFLAVAGFDIRSAFAGQMVAKLTVTAAVVAVVGATRALLRHPVQS